MLELPDINVLVALIDHSHQHHSIAWNWFTQAEPTGWATCSLTESGYVRVVTSTGFNNAKVKPVVSARYLRNFLATHAATHHFIPDEARIIDATRYDLRHLTGHNQVPDLHLSRIMSAERRASRYAGYCHQQHIECTNSASSESDPLSASFALSLALTLPSEP